MNSVIGFAKEYAKQLRSTWDEGGVLSQTHGMVTFSLHQCKLG